MLLRRCVCILCSIVCTLYAIGKGLDLSWLHLPADALLLHRTLLLYVLLLRLHCLRQRTAIGRERLSIDRMRWHRLRRHRRLLQSCCIMLDACMRRLTYCISRCDPRRWLRRCRRNRRAAGGQCIRVGRQKDLGLDQRKAAGESSDAQALWQLTEARVSLCIGDSARDGLL